MTIRNTSLGEAAVTIQVNHDAVEPVQIDDLKTELIDHVNAYNAEHPKSLVTSLCLQYHNGKSNAADFTCKVDKIFGDEYIHEEILGLK